MTEWVSPNTLSDKTSIAICVVLSFFGYLQNKSLAMGPRGKREIQCAGPEHINPEPNLSGLEGEPSPLNLDK